MNHRKQQQPSPFPPPPSTRTSPARSMFVSTKPPPPPTTSTTTTSTTLNANTATTTTNNNKPARISPKNDVSIPMPGEDSTSSLSWSPPNNYNNNNNLLVSSNWDSGVRCWKVDKNQHQQQQQQQQQGGVGGGGAMMVHATPQAMVNHENAVLDTCFSPDGTVVFSGGCDMAVRMWDLGAKLPAPATTANNNNKHVAPQIGAHDAPICSVRFLKAHGGLVVSAGWDNKVKFWDERRSKEPVVTLTLSDRVHAMDVKDNLLVVATADQKIVAYDCSNDPRPLPAKNSLQGDQVRTITCFPDSTGYAIGGSAGRVALEYLEDIPRPHGLKPFTFWAHRDITGPPKTYTLHAVNSISFFDTHKLATTGSDGKIAFWDKQLHKRLGAFDEAIQRPIPCAMFNADSSLLAYAGTYDWSKGCMHAQSGNQVFLHSMTL